MKQFSVEELLDTAIQRAGVNDFGDTGFREGLDILVNGINRSENLIEDRAYMIREQFLRHLTNRLWRTKDLSENPDILDQPVLSPTVIISLPRTGTTKLQQVLEAMNHFYQPLCWQLHRPARIPGMVDGGRALRFAETKKFYEWRMQASPDLHKLHTTYPDKADEETIMLDETFKHMFIGQQHFSEEYYSWLAAQDLSSSYDYLLTQLKYLHWEFHHDNPRPWLLKSPGYLGYEDQVTRLFPEGLKTIYLHRAPVEIVPSASKLMEAFKNLYYDNPPQNRKACEEILDWITSAIRMHMQWRDTNPSVDILDLSFKEVSEDSVKTCEKVCEFIGLEFTDEIRQRIIQWDKDNPRYKHGKASYSIEDYGLNEAQVNEAFSDYLDRFGDYIHN